MKYQNLFYSKNTQYVALLLALKQNLESCYWQNEECVFVFDDEAECKKLITHFVNQKIHIEALSLFEAIETVKNILHVRIHQ